MRAKPVEISVSTDVNPAIAKKILEYKELIELLFKDCPIKTDDGGILRIFGQSFGKDYKSGCRINGCDLEGDCIGIRIGAQVGCGGSHWNCVLRFSDVDNQKVYDWLIEKWGKQQCFDPRGNPNRMVDIKSKQPAPKPPPAPPPPVPAPIEKKPDEKQVSSKYGDLLIFIKKHRTGGSLNRYTAAVDKNIGRLIAILRQLFNEPLSTHRFHQKVDGVMGWGDTIDKTSTDFFSLFLTQLIAKGLIERVVVGKHKNSLTALGREIASSSVSTSLGATPPAPPSDVSADPDSARTQPPPLQPAPQPPATTQVSDGVDWKGKYEKSLVLNESILRIVARIIDNRREIQNREVVDRGLFEALDELMPKK